MPLPRPPQEVPRENDIMLLAPEFRSRIDALLNDMTAAGFDPIVFETLRTDARQEYLYGFGRFYNDGRCADGKFVTNSRDADETWHGFGLAVDIISRAHGWNAPEAFWRALHRIARKYGLVSGADWDNDGIMDDWDKPHVQWGAPMRRSPSPRAARLRDAGGLEAVWREVGALAA